MDECCTSTNLFCTCSALPPLHLHTCSAQSLHNLYTSGHLHLHTCPAPLHFCTSAPAVHLCKTTTAQPTSSSALWTFAPPQPQSPPYLQLCSSEALPSAALQLCSSEALPSAALNLCTVHLCISDLCTSAPLPTCSVPALHCNLCTSAPLLNHLCTFTEPPQHLWTSGPLDLCTSAPLHF